MEVSLPIFLAGCKMEAAPRGRETIRLELVSAIALEILAGHSSPLYFRLYEQGLVNSDFSASFDSAVGAAYAMFGGETREPERVFEEVKKELRMLCEKGPDAELFRRIKKASTGANIRSLNSFSATCSSIVEGHFRGYDAMETPELLESVTEEDVAAFYREKLLPDNMAMSVITPK
jgi:predicted Zn-dependent peptidase